MRCYNWIKSLKPLFVLLLSGCASVASIYRFQYRCDTFANTQGCLAMCLAAAGESGSLFANGVPLACPRLFCMSGGQFNGGVACSATNSTNGVSQAEINAYFQGAVKVSYDNMAGTGSGVNDNGLQYLMTLANKLNSAANNPEVISVVGMSAGYVPGMINGDDGTNSNSSSLIRSKFMYNGQLLVRDQGTGIAPSFYSLLPGVGNGSPSSNCNDGYCTADTTQWYAGSSSSPGGSGSYSRGASSIVGRLLGFNLGGASVSGVAPANTKVYLYNALDNWILTQNGSSNSLYLPGAQTGQTNTGGANYIGLLDRIAMSIDWATGRPTTIGARNELQNGGVFLFAMPSIKDGSGLGQGLNALYSGTSGEQTLSYLLQSCTGTGCAKNATFAEVLQLRYFTAQGGRYYIEDDNMATMNYTNGIQQYEVANSLLNAVRHNPSIFMVVGAGTSSINDTQGSAGMALPGSNLWNLSKNIYQSTGSVYAWYNSTAQYSFAQIGDLWAFAPEMVFGNRLGTNTGVAPIAIWHGNNPNNASSILRYENFVTTQYEGADMAFTGSYPTLWLAYLWMQNGMVETGTNTGSWAFPANLVATPVVPPSAGNNYNGQYTVALYQNSSGGSCTPGSFGCNQVPVQSYSTGASEFVWRDASGTSCLAGSSGCTLQLIDQIRFHQVTNMNATTGVLCDPSVDSNCVAYNNLYTMGALSQLSIKYSLTAPATFLVAGAMGSDNKLIEYTNVAGITKYNYFAVNVNNQQQILTTNTANGNGLVINRNPTPGSGTVDSSTDYLSQVGFKVVNAGVATYNGDPSQIAAAMLSGYVTSLEQVYNNKIPATILTYGLGLTATHMVGVNYINATGSQINQNVVYMTNSFGDNTTTGNAEIASANTINATGARDLFIFTGTGSAFNYDEMYNLPCTGGVQFCTPGNLGSSCQFGTTPDCHPSINNTVCGQGNSCYTGEDSIVAFFGRTVSGNQVQNGSFFTYKPDTSLSGNYVNISIGGKAYQNFYNALFSSMKVADNTPWFDPMTYDLLTTNNGASAGVATVNTLYIPDYQDNITGRFNISPKFITYYQVKMLGCDGTTQGCDPNTWYDAINNSTSLSSKQFQDMLVVCSSPSGSATCKTVVDYYSGNLPSGCSLSNPLACTCPSGMTCHQFKYTTGGYDGVALKYYNDTTNVIMLAEEDSNGQFKNLGGKTVAADVFALDKQLTSKDLYCTGSCPNHQGQYYDPNTNSWKNYYDPSSPNGTSTTITSSCAINLVCTPSDLKILIKENQNLFVQDPSNVFGKGMVNLKETVDFLNYYQAHYYGNTPSNQLANTQSMFYYNNTCVNSGSNCGVVLSSELGFNYEVGGGTKNGAVPPWLTQPTGNDGRIVSSGTGQPVVGYMQTALGNVELTANTINRWASHNQTAVNAEVMLSYAMGLYTPAMNGAYADIKRVNLKNDLTGSSFNAMLPVIGAAKNFAGEQIFINGTERWAFSPVERNTDSYGDILIGSMSPLQSMVSGVKYSQEVGREMRMSMSFFGNKNEDDLINTNIIGAKINNSSLYMFTASQQGIFGNPYVRYAGGYTGSMYSMSKSFNNGWQVRFATAQASNPMMSVFAYGAGTYDAFLLQQMSFGANTGNSLQEMQVMYTTSDMRSSYGFSFGTLTELGGTVLGTSGLGLNKSGTAVTPYFDMKIIQHITHGVYFLGHLTSGVSVFSGGLAAGSMFYNFTPIVALGWGAGLVKDNIFGGSLFFTYSEPLRVVYGSAALAGFDVNKNATNIGGVNFVNLAPERQFEGGYSFSRGNYTISLSVMHRMNANSLVGVNDTVGMIRFSTIF